MATSYGDFSEQAKVLIGTQLRANADKAIFEALASGGSGQVIYTNSDSSLTGASANMMIMDDVYDQFEEVENLIEASIKHIQRSQEMIERVRDKRFRSPYNPNRIFRWFQKRSTAFWVWAMVLPIWVGTTAAGGIALYQNFGWIPATILAWTVTVGTVLAMTKLD